LPLDGEVEVRYVLVMGWRLHVVQVEDGALQPCDELDRGSVGVLGQTRDDPYVRAQGVEEVVTQVPRREIVVGRKDPLAVTPMPTHHDLQRSLPRAPTAGPGGRASMRPLPVRAATG